MLLQHTWQADVHLQVGHADACVPGWLVMQVHALVKYCNKSGSTFKLWEAA
jgi:hypothetical protein